MNLLMVKIKIKLINYKLQMAKNTSDNVQSFAIGLNKGFVVNKIEKVDRPSQRKSKTSNRVREIRKVMRSVCEMSPFEKKVLEMFKTGISKVQKRAFKIIKKRLGTRARAMTRKNKLDALIKEMNKKEHKKH